MASAPPAWVIDKVREMLADGLKVPYIAAQLCSIGHACTPRQVKRWKIAHGLRQVATLTDAELDGIVDELRDAGESTPTEGYRWLHSAINKKIAPKLVGEKRVCKALRRVAPDDVAARSKMMERRLVRRIYHGQHYGEAGFIDFNCKATLPGGVKLYTYGHVRPRPHLLSPHAPPTVLSRPSAPAQFDGDTRFCSGLEIVFVKTAKAAYDHGFFVALQEDAFQASDAYHIDAVLGSPPSRHEP